MPLKVLSNSVPSGTLVWVLTSILIIFVIRKLKAQSNWCYDDSAGCGPSHWTGLCASGPHQSPVNINPGNTTKAQPKRTLIFSAEFYEKDAFNVIDTGQFVAIREPSQNPVASHIRLKGTGLGGTYGYFASRFHWGAEHLIKGRRYALELQIIFQKQTLEEKYAVISIIFAIGKTNNLLTPITNLLPQMTLGKLVAIPGGFNLSSLLPPLWDVFRYTGSLSTPPCNETALWSVFTQRVYVSQAQINAFNTLKDNNGKTLTKNYRPIQKLQTGLRKSVYWMEMHKEKMIRSVF